MFYSVWALHYRIFQDVVHAMWMGEWKNYGIIFVFAGIIVFFQNIPDNPLLSQQATRWANASDEFHGLKQHRHGVTSC